MISRDELVYETRMGMNKLNSSAHQDIPEENILIALNNAQTDLIKKKISGNNLYRMGLDGFKKRYQDLQFLIEYPDTKKYYPKIKNTALNRWELPLSDVKPKLMFYLDAYTVCSKAECKKRVVYGNGDLIAHSNITTILQNNNYKPSFEYQELIIDISNDKISFYTDGSFKIDEAYIGYIRYPKQIGSKDIIDFSGNDGVDQDCELEPYLKTELVDLAVHYLSIATSNEKILTLNKEKLNNNE